jgi:hypothetical protein
MQQAYLLKSNRWFAMARCMLTAVHTTTLVSALDLAAAQSH